jgi:hypothetical protein
LCTAVTAPPPQCETECLLDDAGRAFARDLAHRKREIGRRHELAGALEHVAIGVKAFGVLAHDDEIDRLAAARRKLRARPGGADVGEQVEPLAQRAGWINPALLGRRIIVVRDRSEDHAVGGFRGREGALRKCRTVLAKRLQPDLDLVERELDMPHA